MLLRRRPSQAPGGDRVGYLPAENQISATGSKACISNVRLFAQVCGMEADAAPWAGVRNGDSGRPDGPALNSGAGQEDAAAHWPRVNARMP